MAQIKAFRGVSHNPERIENLAQVVCPPYDVISSAEQAAFFEQSIYNIIRIELPPSEQGAPSELAKYDWAGETWRRWLAERILIQDETPTIYVYRQGFVGPGGWKRRLGFFALTQLEPFGTGSVLPHEKTLAKPKVDRLNLMRATAANISPIFGLYQDPTSVVTDILDRVAQQDADVVIHDDREEHHYLWRLTDPEAIATITGYLAKQPIYIADGHHRYETAIAYRDEQRDLSGNGPWDYVMMGFVPMEDPGLVILPTHRLLHGLPSVDLPDLIRQLETYFSVDHFEDEASFLHELQVRGAFSTVFGLYSGNASYHLFQLTAQEGMSKLLPEHSRAYRELNVVALDTILFRKILGLSERSIAEQEHLAYNKDAREAIAQVRAGTYQLACLLAPTRIEQLRDVAEAGEFMPQKSTYFYPKLLTGLVMNRLDEA